MNRRDFIKTAVAAAVIVSLPIILHDADQIYSVGDIRRYGARPGIDCTAAIQAAIDDCSRAYIPAGEWQV